MILLASDHAGFALKRHLLGRLEGRGLACRDLGVFAALASLAVD